MDWLRLVTRVRRAKVCAQPSSNFRSTTLAASESMGFRLRETRRRSCRTGGRVMIPQGHYSERFHFFTSDAF